MNSKSSYVTLQLAELPGVARGNKATIGMFYLKPRLWVSFILSYAFSQCTHLGIYAVRA